MQAGDSSDCPRVIVFIFYRILSLAELQVVVEEALDVEAEAKYAGCILEDSPESIANQRSEGLQHGSCLRPAAPWQRFNPGLEHTVF
jgi:hypothetical protein